MKIRGRINVEGLLMAAHARRLEAVKERLADEAAEAATSGNPRRAHYLENLRRQPDRPVGPGSGRKNPIQDRRTMRSLTSQLYRAARLSASGRAIRTGHVARRVKNVALGRAVGRSGGWRWLWK